MKIAIAQYNPVVGDIANNLTKAVDAWSRAAQAGASLIVFSELYLTGYPPKDLLEKPWFIDRTEAALNELVRRSVDYPDTAILIGAPLRWDNPAGKGLANAAWLIGGGKVLHHQAKSLLPTYDVFDEARYFDPAPSVVPVPFGGEQLGISVCEDAWNDPAFWPQRRRYDRDPIEELARQGATVLINISASPFEMSKEETRYRLIRSHAVRYGIPFVYVNQVGANDELIFDGGSMVFDRQGTLLALSPAFREDLTVVDLKQATQDQPGAPASFVAQDRVASVHDALVLGIADYLRKSGFTKAVVGLSGGIDSAVTCCLAAEALGAENVLGISMPSPYSSMGSVEDSRLLAANLGVPFKVIPIADIYHAYLFTLEEHFEGRKADVTEENLQARIRGNMLMAFSNKFGHLLLSTGNKSELATGYCTLYGDMSGGLSVLSDVPKTLVYELAEHINREREIIPRIIIEKAPSAELRPGQKDQDTLPPYPVLDAILQLYIEEGQSAEAIIERGFEAEMVRWVIKTVNRSEYKRRQAAPGLKVTSKAFGVGRRMPVAAKY
ncbi:nad+ synthetase [Heliomicrobium modesticaldum Ice1]|uniref:Glutamine-dependent NAD(+) synthetase n=1 Tax=Heliobacterium modesticaldum (strain ATCC 51547 / Ice1) TaxID=498761 RepID=B0TCE3_HELMI|nr:NAD+ synthase [Heliomicrobium modesticaldum]ABZ85331.1 nad+ synthetase [Heliomicrobium modesticaldum Ice1]